MVTLQEFHQDFLQSILSDTESRGITKPKSFFENVCEELITTGDLSSNYEDAEYNKKGIEIYGYDYDEERDVLTLLAHQFFQSDSIQTLTKNLIETKFKSLKKFFSNAQLDLYKSMEEGFSHYSMAYKIYLYSASKRIRKVRLMLITDGKATRNLSNIDSEFIDGIEFEFRVIDIEYLYKIYTSNNSGADFEISVNLPALQVDTVSGEYQSFLTVIDGDSLATIYEKFGQKIFEQNVRTFLQFRGNVNKGLRNTIEYSPEMFFAYNNGITATASHIELDDNQKIIKIINFQIVNGGQTTSSIYAAKKNSKLDVSKIKVQMKLSVVSEKQQQDQFISNVSEYANTQNKINKSDFFSNNPFHKEFKRYSQRVWVAAIGGEQRRTHWFYERVRGEYLNEQVYLTEAKKKQFKLEHPKTQLINKTFLAKSETAWNQKPDIVSKGAEYSFVNFADSIASLIEKDTFAITECYFKEAVSRIILFKTLEKIVSNAKWYNGGYRAQTVAYTVSLLSYLLVKDKKNLNFILIWETQSVPPTLHAFLELVAEKIYSSITNPPEGNVNIGQWCKKPACWEKVKKIEMILALDEELLVENEERKYKRKEEKEKKKLDSSIEIQAFVVRLEKIKWSQLLNYYSNEETSHMQLDILSKYASGALLLPTPKQSNVLYQLYIQAVSEGVELYS